MRGITDLLSRLESERRLRTIPAEPAAGMLDLSSNDYLGLGKRCDEFREEFLDRFSDASFTSSASRLLSTRQKYHYLLEETLESIYGKPSLLFNSGYHANVGCVGALSALPDTLFICDKLIHASIIDGLRIAGNEFRRFPHNDITKVREIIEKNISIYKNLVIVVESIYSMDGDTAPLQELASLKKTYPQIILYVDEAHAFGVRGKHGLGLSEELGLAMDIDLIIGTFGKAAASAGAFVACDDNLKSLLINFARPFIFSTALPPANIAWSMLMVEKIVGMNREREKLSTLSQWFSSQINEISGYDCGSSSQIIPFLTGNAETALELAGKLRKKGIISLPIRRPTVPPGGERIRFSLSSGMSRSDLLPVFDIINHYKA